VNRVAMCEVGSREKRAGTKKKKVQWSAAKKIDCHEPHPAPNEKTQPIQWTERPTGALVAINSLWPRTRPFQSLLFKTVHDMVYKFNKKKVKSHAYHTFWCRKSPPTSDGTMLIKSLHLHLFEVNEQILSPIQKHVHMSKINEIGNKQIFHLVINIIINNDNFHFILQCVKITMY